jgi:hypothetical protein
VSWSVEWSKGARKDLDGLDADVAKRVVRAVDRLAETGQGDEGKEWGARGWVGRVTEARGWGGSCVPRHGHA